jgi:PAS domain S-box-containing protein
MASQYRFKLCWQKSSMIIPQWSWTMKAMINNFKGPLGAVGFLGSEEAWYHFVMDRLPLGVITVDHSRRITYINPEAQMLTGWAADPAIGRFCGEVLQGGQCKAQCPLQTVLNRDRDMVDLRTSMTDRSGRKIPIRLRTVALYNDEERLIGAVETFIDISRTVALEEERERTLGFFAHDMKSPLVGAIGFMERLLAGKAGDLNDKQLEYLGMVRTQLMRVQELVRDYLDVLRLSSFQTQLNLERVELAELLAELSGTFQARAEDKGLDWRLTLEEDLGSVKADRRRLSRALGNLLDNAVKFSSSGEVILSCKKIDGGSIRLLICDQGPGLTPEDEHKLFSPFFRGSAGRHVEGTGLGLAAVKSIVDAHGGEVSAFNRQEGGACFSVILPVAYGDTLDDK